MFKKFNVDENVSGRAQMKSSVQRGLRAALEEQMPSIAPYLEDLIPKKDKVILVKCQDHVNIITTTENPAPLFFNLRDGPYYPTLRVLHKFPELLPQVQVDRGAIKHVMKGADIMCPGLTSPGGRLPPDLDENCVVAVMAEGKTHAVGVGRLKMKSAEIAEINKGIGIENVHYLGDGLWATQTVA